VEVDRVGHKRRLIASGRGERRRYPSHMVRDQFDAVLGSRRGSRPRANDGPVSLLVLGDRLGCLRYKDVRPVLREFPDEELVILYHQGDGVHGVACRIFEHFESRPRATSLSFAISNIESDADYRVLLDHASLGSFLAQERPEVLMGYAPVGLREKPPIRLLSLPGLWLNYASPNAQPAWCHL